MVLSPPLSENVISNNKQACSLNNQAAKLQNSWLPVYLILLLFLDAARCL